MLVKDFEVTHKGIYKVSRGIKGIIDSEDDNSVEKITELLNGLSKEEIIEALLWKYKSDYFMNQNEKVGDKYYSNRFYIEEIYHCNATALYPSVSEKEKVIRVDKVHGEVEREYFYYYRDSGTVCRSYVETLVGVGHKDNPNLPCYLSDVVAEDDEVLVEVVGIIPTDRQGNLVFGI